MELSAVQTVSLVKETFNCLLGSGVSFCEYNPANPPIYLSIGDALAAAGLIFAAYQLADKRWKLRHQIRSRYSMFVIWIGCFLGIISTLFASLLPQISLDRTSLFSYPIVWEVISLCFFTTGVAHFVIIGLFQRRFFNEKNAENFYYVTLSQISHTEPEVIIDIVNDNLNRIMKISSSDDASNKYANAILECIVSVDQTIEYLVTKKLDFIFNFFRLVKNQKKINRGMRNAINGILKKLYQSEDSLFYSQYKHKGLSRFASVFDLIFSEPKILREIDLFMSWEAFEYPMRPDSKQLKGSYLGVYLHSISVAMKTYFNDQSYGLDGFFYNAFKEIKTYCSFIGSTQLDKDETFKIIINSRLHEVADFLGREFLNIYSEAFKNKKIGEEEKLPLFDTHRGENVLGMYVDALIDYMDSISRLEDYGQARILAGDAYFTLLKTYNPNTVNIYDAFIKKVWEEIDRSIEDGGYPVLSRIYFDLINWSNPDGLEIKEYEKARKFLYEKILPTMQAKEKMRNNKDDKAKTHLPPEIKYSVKKKIFEYHYKDETVEIPAPKKTKVNN